MIVVLVAAGTMVLGGVIGAAAVLMYIGRRLWR